MTGAQRPGALAEFLRTYSVALAFVLGQIAPLALTPPRQQPAIVRVRADERDALGFDPRERLSPHVILTAPLHTAGKPANSPHPTREPAWLRDN